MIHKKNLPISRRVRTDVSGVAHSIPANRAGLPAMWVPCGFSAGGLPIGLQILAKPFDEETCFTVGAAIERAANFTSLPGIRA